ncbi:uncharacterized protein J7T55_015311 [Diaporthe amygdali]|uniref:uncharacterized protein n=1 Tax=Phomopsis amygdali TaxID=1214568 RepID=UPI0022FE8C19|nr:uncharacterized protein J7T55_015311 [Diaporthe amygdali]KAJ0120582.1 uncharacterized protein J7T55_015311 [Diaporthe amygdali]
MRYEPTFFQRGWKANYTLMGTPSNELDDAWDDILQHYYSEVPHQFMEALGRLDEGIRLDNGNYIATYGVMHQIHCLKRIHHAFYPDYYYTEWTEKEKSAERKHTYESPLTMRWLDDTPEPNGNPVIAHECVNWDLLMDEFTRKRVDPSVFVHPKFGKPWQGNA